MHTNNLQYFPHFILESLPVATLTMDRDFKITYFSSRMEELTGYSAEEAKGQPCHKILQSSKCDTECPLKNVQHYEDAKTGLEAEFINHFGEHIPVRIGTAAIEDDTGRFVGYLEVIEDISREKALEREKNNFLFMVAHDMKSPLIAIQGLTKRLREHYKEMNPEKMEKYFKSITEAGEQVEAQVMEFLEFSRQSIEKVKLTLEDTDLEEIIDNIIYRHKSRALEKNIKVNCEYESPMQIKADSIQLQRVFENLLDNALKFTQKHGEILFSTRETNKEVIIQVRDNGPGIDVNELPYIFDAFHQSNSSDKGHGLGLAAVKAIVQKHGGRVSAKSKPGEGSVFTVRLPKEKK